MDRRWIAGAVALLAACLGTGSAEAQGAAAPLSVSKDCRLLKDGKPYRAIGVNYYDAFLRHAANPRDISFRAGFQRLKDGGIPFVRLAVLPFWPKEAQRVVDDPDAFLARFDDVVHAAEATGIGLVPSVFFNYRSVPDLFGEPQSAWGDRNSRTVAFMRDFAQRIAARYRGSRAIWMWEFTNEANAYADLPTAYRYAPVAPAQGTPAERTPRDNISSKDLYTALSVFTDAIHAGDPTRLVTSGYDFPRNNAAALSAGRAGRDTVDDFRAVMKRDYPAGTQVVSVHLYPDRTSQFADRAAAAADLVPLAASAAHALCKPLFIGEFGAPADKMSPADSDAAYATLLDAIVRSDTDLAAFWVYDFAFQEDKQGAFNATYTNARAGRLQRLKAANDQLQPR